MTGHSKNVSMSFTNNLKTEDLNLSLVERLLYFYDEYKFDKWRKHAEMDFKCFKNNLKAKDPNLSTVEHSS